MRRKFKPTRAMAELFRRLRPAAFLIGLMLLPVSVGSDVSSDRAFAVELRVNKACGQGRCCFVIGEVCDAFPNGPENHRYYVSGKCPD